MIQFILRYLRGYVRIRVEGDSTERFLNLCSYHGIMIRGLTPCYASYEMFLSVEDFRRLRPIIRKTHAKVTLLRRYGLPFLMFRNRKRILFLPGFVLCLILLTGYSSFIWDIHFEGNETHTDAMLLEFLNENGVAPAMPKSRVDCSQIGKDIRKAYNDIVWVSVSVEGSRLCVQVKENEDYDTREEEEGGQPRDIIAAADGVITEIVTRSGVPLVHIGDTVKKGDILVCGRVEVLNDAKEVTGYRYCQADAEVYADTQIPYENTIQTTYAKKQYSKKEQRILYYLKSGDWQFSLGSIKHSFSKWETYTWEERIKWGESFYLPFAWGKIHLKAYRTVSEKYTKKQIQTLLTDDFQRFSKELEEKGVQIYGNSVKIYLNGNSATASGTLDVNQKITDYADTEILEPERNEQDESFRTDN